MGFHPGNLTFRFLLEIVALVGLYRLGSHLGSGGWQLGLAVGLTLAGILIWPTYRVPGDASAKGDAAVAVSGTARLVIELVIFGAGAWGWFLAGPAWFAWSFLAALILHHVVSYDRIGWLLQVNSSGQPPFDSP
jgi:hypothetical protein